MPARLPDTLLFAAPTTNADMRWFSHFHAGDPFPALSIKGKKIGILPLLEVGRAKTESDFDVILNLTELIGALRKKNPKAGVSEVIVHVARQHGARSFVVPHDFPSGLWVSLQKLGLRLSLPGTGRDERSSPQVFPQRAIKTKHEEAGIAAGNRASSAGFAAVERILRESTIKAGYVRWKGKVLTAETLHSEVHKAVTDAGGMNDHGLIIAPGDQAVDCHCAGSGPVRAHEPIVVDIFPRNLATGLYGDMTRTYLKGKASPARRRMIETVFGAHRAALKALRAGATGAEVYFAAANFIKDAGYVTENRKGTYVGFFHGLGHGLGYDVHEEPSLSFRNEKPLRPGHVVTIEPGLYYPGLGGCRFEDVAVVTKTGHRLLSKHPYRWEIA
ncbi:MAG: M24 family metallopeptidase [Opitutales bacterium]